MVQIKHAYDKANKKDGYRVLVDRLWPRGIKKEQLKMDEWPKEIAPSTEARKNFNHEVKNWKTFSAAYKKELKTPLAKEKIAELAKKAKKHTVTLVYGAHDPIYNHAQLLKKAIEKY